MAGLYQRVAGRGFGSAVADGMTGAGALESQGGPQKGQELGLTAQGQYTTLPGYLPEQPPGVDVPILEGTWGLAGSATVPDSTPRTHAAPVPGWAGSYSDPELLTVHENSAVIHSADFGALAGHLESPASAAEPQIDAYTFSSQGENQLQPLSGQIRAMGGYDATQGYGGGGSGPGGVNGYGFADVRRTRITATDPQPMAYLDPAERPFVVPQAAGAFAPTDAIWGPAPQGTFLDAGNINTTPQTSFQAAPEPETAPAAPQGAPASAGWW